MVALLFDVHAKDYSAIMVSSSDETIPQNTSSWRRLGALLSGAAATIIVAGCGPIYIHDQANLAAAQKAQQQFTAVVEEGRSARLVAGQRQQRKVLDELDGVLDEASREVQIAALSSANWERLASAIEDEQKAVAIELGKGTPVADLKCDEPTSRRMERDCVAKELQAKLVAAGGASDQAATLVDAMNQAAGAEARYAATQKLLSTGVVALVQPQSDPKVRAAALEALARNCAATDFRGERWPA